MVKVSLVPTLLELLIFSAHVSVPVVASLIDDPQYYFL